MHIQHILFCVALQEMYECVRGHFITKLHYNRQRVSKQILCSIAYQKSFNIATNTSTHKKHTFSNIIAPHCIITHTKSLKLIRKRKWVKINFTTRS